MFFFFLFFFFFFFFYLFRRWLQSIPACRSYRRCGRIRSGRTCRSSAGRISCTWRCSSWVRIEPARGKWAAGRRWRPILRESASANQSSAPKCPNKRLVQFHLEKTKRVISLLLSANGRESWTRIHHQTRYDIYIMTSLKGIGKKKIFYSNAFDQNCCERYTIKTSPTISLFLSWTSRPSKWSFITHWKEESDYTWPHLMRSTANV